VNTANVAERAAIQRLLAGQRIRSTGALTVLQLAAEAGVKRRVLTHKHVDLKDEFERRRTEIGGVPAAFQALHARAIDAEAANTPLAKENKRLRDQIEVYAQVIHELTVERRRRAAPPASGGNKSSTAAP
jgi:hypothetical protein